MEIQAPHTKKKEDIYYVYMLIDSLTDNPIYVGKGKGSRMYHHEKMAERGTHVNKRLIRKIKKIKQSGGCIIYRKVKEGMANEQAMKFERETIKSIGIDNLCNLTEGGEGSSGYKHTMEAKAKMIHFVDNRDYYGINNPNYGGGNWSEDAKRQYSKLKSEQYAGENNPFYGKIHTIETKEKMSKLRKNKTITEEHKRKIKQNHAFAGKKRPEISKIMTGENNIKSRLNKKNVIEIRTTWDGTTQNIKCMAEKYGVHKDTIRDVLRNRTWRNM